MQYLSVTVLLKVAAVEEDQDSVTVKRIFFCLHFGLQKKKNKDTFLLIHHCI